MVNKLLLIVCLSALLSSCMNEAYKLPTDFYATEFFRDVQQSGIFPDSKTFVDCTPRKPIGDILSAYRREKDKKGFSLKEFVDQNFDLPDRPATAFTADSLRTMEQHIESLWPVLTRKADVYNANASLIPLPDRYVVPGGRFSEVYYWDSYFTMLGLQLHGRNELIGSMVDNFTFLIDSIGFIPNGNRNYYLSRSQPPFYSLMVKLVSDANPDILRRYLPALRKEYAFWMNGSGNLKAGSAYSHVVMMPDGVVLNRYFDSRPEPRPEAFKEDLEVAKRSGRVPEEVYGDIRAAAESGWDFSSRWFADGNNLESIQTTSIIPVDLNCLLYHLEMMIAAAYKVTGEEAEAEKYRVLAENRRTAILKYFWNDEDGFFYDYNFRRNEQMKVKSLAGAYPLFFEIASEAQANAVAVVIREEFLKPGGLVTTLSRTGQQWDSPNGWAPLQWITYSGLKRYGQKELAAEIRKRWVRQNQRVYDATGKMMEKYNVMDTALIAGGGEYPNQDGFGWTNGVVLALIAEETAVKRD